MGRNGIDILSRLLWIANACERIYGIHSDVAHTPKGVPYVRVGRDDKVRVVIFAKTRKVRVFYRTDAGEQIHEDFPMGLHGNVDSWVQLVAAFASGMAPANTPDS